MSNNHFHIEHFKKYLIKDFDALTLAFSENDVDKINASINKILRRIDRENNFKESSVEYELIMQIKEKLTNFSKADNQTFLLSFLENLIHSLWF